MLASDTVTDPHELPEDVRAIAERELNETPQRRTAALAELRTLLAGGPALHRSDDAYLVMYLRWAKFDAKKALSRLRALEKWIETSKEYLGDWRQYRAEQFRWLYALGFMRTVKGHAKDGSLVMMLLPLKLKPGDLDQDPYIMLKWNLWMLHGAVHDKRMQVSGQLIIETFQGMSFFQAVQFGRGIIPPLVMKQNMAFMNQCAPYRLRGIWLFHQGMVVSILMAIIHPFLSKKMKERIRAFGSDYSALHQLVNPSVLPVEFGGTSTDDGWDWFESLMQDDPKDGQEAQWR